jgi:tripartite-type tricarboxylate transporter receptor subunit TctC
VSFAAGGPRNVFARPIGSKLEKELGQPIFIENEPGGGSSIGSEFVAKAESDGYTLLVGTVASSTNMGIYKNLDTTR